MTPRVTKARFHPAPSSSNDRGLVGWIDFVLDDSIGIDGVALRRGHDGRTVFVYPKRRDRGGRAHAIVRPMDDHTRTAIEAQIVAMLVNDGSLVADRGDVRDGSRRVEQGSRDA